MIRVTRKYKKYAYGDYMEKPYSPSGVTVPGQYGTFNQDVNNALNTQDLLPNNNNAIAQKQAAATTVPKQSNYNSTMNSIGAYAGAADGALKASGISQSTGKYDQAIEGAAAAVPVWGTVYNLTRSVSDGIKGDGRNKEDAALASFLSPSSGVTSALDSGSSFGEAVVAGLLPGLGAEQTSKRLREQDKVDKRREEAEKLKQYQNVLANYNTSGYGKYGMKFPNGGQLPYTIDGSEVNQLASNVAQYEGDTHEQGGIQLNNGAEIEDEEVVKDDMVLSDRLNPSDSIKYMMKGLGTQLKSNDTYASVAERLGTKKGEFESKVNSTRLGEANSAKLMIERYDKAIDVLFQDQQMNKIQNKIGTYAYGGSLNEGNPTSGKTPTFKTQTEHINYYRPLAVEKMTPEDRAIYEETVKTKGQDFGDTWIASRGGLPAFVPVKSQPQVITYSGDSLPTKFNNSTSLGGYRYNARGGQGLPAKQSITPTYAKGGTFFDSINDNSGDIMNSIGFLANQAQINNLETDYTPELVKNPAFTYRDRTSFLRNEFGKQFTTASKGLNQSNSQDNIALKANMYASTLNGLNGALDNEAQRKDNLDAYYNQLANRTSAQNAQILNYNKEYGINARNNRRALTQQNTDSLIRGYMGNKTQRELQTLDWDKAYIQALSSGDTGVAQRLMAQMPEEIRRRRFGNYDYKVKK